MCFRPWPRRILVAFAAALVATAAAVPAHAQADEQAVVGVVTHFFDGMRARDTALMRSTVAAGTVLVSASGPTGLGDPTPVDQFIERVGKGTGPGGNEQIKDPKVMVDGPMASLWAYYTLTRGGETQINHCGVDAFLLRKGPDGWKIFHVADTRRTEGCTPITK
jgi:ketosteroid isomerase-like protein